MKIKTEDYRRLSEAIGRVPAERGKTFTEMQRAYQNRKLGAMRLRWDLLCVSGFDTQRLYAYLDDAHIDTALRAICRELTELEEQTREPTLQHVRRDHPSDRASD